MEGLAPEQVRTLLRWFKEGPPGAIPIEQEGRSLGLLQAVTWEDAGDRLALERLGRWHETAFAWFPEPFAVSPASARQWLVERVLPAADRVLFWVRDVRGEHVGHVGLSEFDWPAGTVAISDVLCGRHGGEALVTAAVAALVRWTGEALRLHAVPAEQQRRALAA